MKNLPKILITPGEPSGIGYDILLSIAEKKFPAQIIAITNLELLKERAVLLKKKINLINVDLHCDDLPLNSPGAILVHDVKTHDKIEVGSPSIKQVPMILQSLDIAIDACMKKYAAAMVTGPVQKNIIMKFGANFSGHTEYIAKKTGGMPIMMLHAQKLRVALLTTHVPLVDVPKLITKKRIKSYVEIISDELYKKFGINDPKINICGLNPHAGEGGYIGKEEENVIIPIVRSMKEKGFNINGPFSADTIFTRKDSDIILAMYHDQALPVIKTLEFGNIVNTTLGLPIVRTSVDHGTALDIAGTNKADAGSLISAINTSIDIVKQKNATQH